MKIYCSRKKRTTEEILDSILGKDTWIKVSIAEGSYVGWIRPLSKKFNDKLGCPVYTCNDWVYTYRPDPDHTGIIHIMDQRNLDYYLGRKSYYSLNRVEPTYPIEMLPTDELFQITGT